MEPSVKKKELEKLLPEEESATDKLNLRRVSSNRFQVSRSGAVDETDPRAESEPPPPRPISTERKSSCSNGRFTISQNEAPGDAVLEETDGLVALPEKTGKGVKFSVGVVDVAERTRDSGESNSTLNMKSWRNMKTIEHPPIIDFYRDSIDIECGNVRPSMAQLIGDKQNTEDSENLNDFEIHNDDLFEASDPIISSPKIVKFIPPPQQGRTKFGWIQGVFVRCLLNIFGVMLYLRIGWVVGQAGILLGSSIVLLASLVTTITALSTCAICTNGDVKGGGAYFLISRSLGPDFGGSIGIIFSVANAVGGAMYIVGFAETVRDILREKGMTIIDGGLWDIRIIGAITCLCLMGIIFLGTSFESKMQMFLLVVLVVSLVNYAIGSFMSPTEEMIMRGATGYSWNTLKSNLMPNFRDEGFFTVFAVYFPAATGIMAGANISGDLANPQKAIPRGTLLAIFVTSCTYLATVWSLGSTNIRDAEGIGYPIWNGTWPLEPACATNGTCPYGLMNFFQVMEMESLWGPLITLGIFAATLSSALASLVSAPKVFQAVCKDKLYPYIGCFAKGYGKDEEPRRAYAIGFAICLAIVAVGELNAIAPIISNFFLASYTLINYACFDQSFSDSPGFRPAFKYYNMYISLGGAVLCLAVMFIIDWVTALLTFLCFAVLFVYLHYRKPNVNWGSSSQAHSYKNALAGMIKLSNTEEHVKNYRPQFLVLTGNPANRPSLVDFVNNVTKGSSLMICGYVIMAKFTAPVCAKVRKFDGGMVQWLHDRKVKAFYSSTASCSLRTGVQNILHLSGLGRLRPNIVILGFKMNWNKEGATEAGLHALNEYFGIIQDSFDMNLGVCILRNGDSLPLDFATEMRRLNVGESKKRDLDEKLNRDRSNASFQKHSVAEVEEVSQQSDPTTNSAAETLNEKDNNSDYEEETEELHESEVELDGDEENEEEDEDVVDDEGKPPHISDDDRKNAHTFSLRRRNSRRPTMEQRALLSSISRFQRKIVKGTIDVWWLYDDGGLTLLIPHLLTLPKSYLEGAKLRVFTISTSTKTMEQEQRSMAALLSKFRIDFSDVNVIADIGRRPQKDLLEHWQNVITPWVAPDDDCPTGMTSLSELSAQKEKTYRQLRTRELLLQHSKNADLIVLTLPVPRKGMISASLYMSWMDVMTANLPPILLVRGNQTSVLTFYS